jgi:hypothetical protein
MGRPLHRQQERRQIRLVPQQPAQGFSADDRRWLATQGIGRSVSADSRSIRVAVSANGEHTWRMRFTTLPCWWCPEAWFG